MMKAHGIAPNAAQTRTPPKSTFRTSTKKRKPDEDSVNGDDEEIPSSSPNTKTKVEVKGEKGNFKVEEPMSNDDAASLLPYYDASSQFGDVESEYGDVSGYATPNGRRYGGMATAGWDMDMGDAYQHLSQGVQVPRSGNAYAHQWQDENQGRGESPLVV
jgi:hypothetical protein